MTNALQHRDDRRAVGLRARISLLFAFGALVVSVVLAGVTLVLARGQLVENREESAAVMAVSNAVRLNNQLTPDTTFEDLPTIVDSLTSLEGSQSLVRLREEWLLPPELGRGDLPGVLAARVEAGEPGQLRAIVGGRPQVVIGLPLPAFDAAYFEIVDLEDVNDTLGSIRIILLSTGAATTLLGAAIGAWASRRALLPLRRGDSFNGMATALEARIRRDARFASEVSHELRSPLMTLTTSVGVLEARRDQFSERSRTALDLLSQDLARFSRLVEDLLEISRFDAGAASLEVTDLNLADFIDATLRATHLAGVPVADPFHGRLVIEADKRRMARVMSNLFVNATRHGAGVAGVVIEADAGTVRIAVEDDGPGVPADERDQVFDRFSRGASAGRRGGDSGAGLGLSLVWEDVRLHGGRVWIEDRPSGAPGARFVVELPRPESTDDEEGRG